jgi:hypothetical protein
LICKNHATIWTGVHLYGLYARIHMKPELTAVAIVLLGRFNPSDFDFQHLRDAKAVANAELERSAYEILLPGQAIGIAFPWGKLQVVGERMVLETAQVPFVRLVDLALKLTREISTGSLVSKVGINVTSHFKFADVAARDRFATHLAPARNWGDFGKVVADSFSQSGNMHGGLMRATMRQASPPDRSAGWLDVTVEPSAALGQDVGVAVMTNDHYESSEEEQTALRRNARALSDLLLDQLGRNFETSVERSLEISRNIVEAGK